MPILITIFTLSVEAGTSWYQIPSKAKSEDFKNPKQRVVDLVLLSIAAHRKGHGDVIWVCWQPGLAGVEIGDVLARLKREKKGLVNEERDKAAGKSTFVLDGLA